MNEEVFGIFVNNTDAPDGELSTVETLPASVWSLLDALDRVKYRQGDHISTDISGWFNFRDLMPYLYQLDANLNELNDLAERLERLDTTQRIAFKGLVQMATQNKGMALTATELRALTASTDCCHVIVAKDVEEAGRYYATQGCVPVLEGLSDQVFNLLDFKKIGEMLLQDKRGVFTEDGYVIQHSEIKGSVPELEPLPEKPDYLFQIALKVRAERQCDDHTAILKLPALEEDLIAVRRQLGTDSWENVEVVDYDGAIFNASDFADLPMEMETFNDFAGIVRKAAEEMPDAIAKLKALLDYFEVKNIDEAIFLAEHLEDYILKSEKSTLRKIAMDELKLKMGDPEASFLLPHIDLYRYGTALIKAHDTAAMTLYGVLQRADGLSLQMPTQEVQQEEMTMR